MRGSELSVINTFLRRAISAMHRDMTQPIDEELEKLLAELEAKWEASQRPGSTAAERQEYTAAAHWGAPRLVAEIRRLTATNDD